MTHRHIVMFSGGIGSFAAADRVIKRHGKENVTLLFTDTLIEDEDLYRFLDDCEIHFGIPVTRIAEGRTPWEVFRDKKMIGNSRIDPCSKILKRDLGDKWLLDNCDPKHTTIYLGIDWTEKHRFDDGDGHGAFHRYARNGWMVESPMCEKPFITKPQMLKMLDEADIEIPRLYKWGFAHNNCGGFCIKAGMDHFALLLEVLPERYAEHEAAEKEFNENYDGPQRTVLRDRRKETGTRPISLAKFRRRIEAGKFVETGEIGGCGCFLDDDPQTKRRRDIRSLS